MNVVFIPEGGGWVAEALQHAFAAQRHTREEALRALAHTIGSQVFFAQRRGIADPLAPVPPAPDEYWEIFERAAKRSTEAAEFEAPSLPPAFVIQAIADRDMRVGR